MDNVAITEEEKLKLKLKAASQPRDAYGHFIKSSDLSNTSNSSGFFKQLLTPSVSKTKDDDTLIDIHVNNPLKKIVELLQEIKRQKAFSFTLRGSLGIMGVILTLSAFGIMGGSKMLCDKGIQTQVGTLKVLNSTSIEKPAIPILSSLISLVSLAGPTSQTFPNRIILLKADRSTIFLPIQPEMKYYNFLNQEVYITGQYDSCSQILKPTSPTDIQLFQ